MSFASVARVNMATISKLVNQKTLCELLNVSRVTVIKWKRLGCPTADKLYDVDAVQAWRLTRPPAASVVMGAKQLRDTRKIPPAAPETPRPASADDYRSELTKLDEQLNTPEGVDGALSRLRMLEKEAYRVYLESLKSDNVVHQQIRLKLHSDITQHLFKAENILDYRKQVRAEVWSEMEHAWTKWSEPVKALIDQMPRAISTRCNVTDPSIAEVALREWVNGQLYPVMNRKPKAEDGQ